MTGGALFFALCAIACLLGAGTVVVARSPIRAAVGLLVTVLGISGLYLLLNAQFLAAIQVIVYAGAVVVLFVFVIMLLGPSNEEPPPPDRWATWRRATLAGSVGGLLAILATGLVLGLSASEGRAPVPLPGAAVDHGSAELLGRLMFTKGLVPFELATVLLLVAIVGAVGVSRNRRTRPEKKTSDHATLRLFRGPVHPRDAGHPLPTKERSR